MAKVVAEMDAGRLVGQPVAVTCFLRGAAEVFPHRWRNGVLLLDGRTLTWRPSLRRQNRAIRLPSRLDVEQVREVRGTEGYLIQAVLFRIVVCQATSGRVEPDVPIPDVPLVLRAILAVRRDQGTSAPAVLGARLLTLVDTGISAGVPAAETVAEINRQADSAITDGVGVSALDPQAYQLAQIELLAAQIPALRRLADSSGDARVTRYADVLSAMYEKLEGDLAGDDPQAGPSPAFLSPLNELIEIRRELGIPDQ